MHFSRVVGDIFTCPYFHLSCTWLITVNNSVPSLVPLWGAASTGVCSIFNETNSTYTVNHLLFATTLFRDLPEVNCSWQYIFATQPYPYPFLLQLCDKYRSAARYIPDNAPLSNIPENSRTRLHYMKRGYQIKATNEHLHKIVKCYLRFLTERITIKQEIKNNEDGNLHGS